MHYMLLCAIVGQSNVCVCDVYGRHYVEKCIFNEAFSSQDNVFAVANQTTQMLSEVLTIVTVVLTVKGHIFQSVSSV